VFSGVRQLPGSFWHVVVLGILFGLSRFAEAFLVLRAGGTGVALGTIPAVMVATNICYSVSAYPAGVLADRHGRTVPLAIGITLVVLGDLVLAWSTGFLEVIAGCCLWGLHLGFTQGVLSKMVADASPAGLRGTAFGVFNLLMGMALLCASLMAGALWDYVGPQATFLTGAGFAVVSGLWLMMTASKR
jgi:MFS family permease